MLYNSRGEAYQSTDPAGMVSQFTFDDAGRKTQFVDEGLMHQRKNNRSDFDPLSYCVACERDCRLTDGQRGRVRRIVRASWVSET
jgi:hypothetical protein